MTIHARARHARAVDEARVGRAIGADRRVVGRGTRRPGGEPRREPLVSDHPCFGGQTDDLLRWKDTVSHVDPGAVDDVIFGCCDTVGPQAGDIARTCWLAAGLPHHVPGVTIDRQFGSSQQSVNFGSQAVMTTSGSSLPVRAKRSRTMMVLEISILPPSRPTESGSHTLLTIPGAAKYTSIHSRYAEQESRCRRREVRRHLGAVAGARWI